jgi:hypothetical protein
MDIEDDLSEQFDPKFRLQRVPRTHDLLSLASKSREASGGSGEWQPLKRHSTNSGSRNSDILYMANPRTQERCSGTLSQISNRSNPRMQGYFDGDGPFKDNDARNDVRDDARDNASEEFSWGVIDQQIYEWQYACRTGRPYWWSPKAKFNRLNTDCSKFGNALDSQVWAGEIGEEPKYDYKVKRRAVSDSFLADSSTVGEMAHMIAVQLLGSCFTLSPDLGVPVPLQNCCPNEKNSSSSLNPLHFSLISSLKMHARYRYSPCFGHQGRNTSPASTKLGTYHGPRPCSPSPPNATGMQTPDIGTSETILRRRRIHRALHVTEGSATNCSLDSHTDQYLKLYSADTILDPIAGAANRPKQQPPNGDSIDENFLSHIPYEEEEAGHRIVGGSLDLDHNSTSRSQPACTRSKPELNLITRSDQHDHDFIQPVKELVARRWQNLRRRFGSSLHSTELGAGSGGFSPISGSRTSSPATENDGRERRRRAQVSGDISSYESTPHYNSPVSSGFGPTGSGTSSPPQMDNETVPPSLALAKSPVMALSSALGSVNVDTTQSNDAECHSTWSKIETCQGCQPHNSPGRSLHEADHATQPDLISMASNVPPSARRSQSRQKRKSMLSEVFTAGDLVDEVTTNGSNEDLESCVPGAIPTALCPPKIDITSGPRLLPMDSKSNGSNILTQKPRLSRTSTSGTQVFSPSDDGVEIDGLPVGLCRHAWDGHGKSRERSYL